MLRGSRRRPFPNAFVISLFGLVWLLPVAAWGESLGREFLPPEHWSYRALYRFEALGFVRLPSEKLFSRDDIRVYLREIEESAATGRRPLSDRDRFDLDRLVKEFGPGEADENPKRRFDPPLLFVEDAPLYLEADVDLSLVPEKTLDDARWAFFLVTHLESRLHVREWLTYEVRYRLTYGPERGDRVRDAKPSPREKSFKGLTSLFERSYLAFRWKQLMLFWGRDYVDWGPAEEGNIHLSETAGTLDRFGARFSIKNFRFSSLQANLWPDPQRRLAGHRLEMAFGGLTVGLSETALYVGRNLDPVYLFPFSSYYANQFNERGDDNIIWSADVKYALGNGVLLYGGLLLDDFQFEREGDAPDKIAFDLAARAALVNPFPVTLSLRYRYVDIYTYTHRDTLKYHIGGLGVPSIGDLPLGAIQGPDADMLTLRADVYPWPSVTTGLGLMVLRRGAGNDYEPFTAGSDESPPFPSPVVERTYAGDAIARWELRGNSSISAVVRVAYVENVGREEGRDEWRTASLIRLTWDL